MQNSLECAGRVDQRLGALIRQIKGPDFGSENHITVLHTPTDTAHTCKQADAGQLLVLGQMTVE